MKWFEETRENKSGVVKWWKSGRSWEGEMAVTLRDAAVYIAPPSGLTGVETTKAH